VVADAAPQEHTRAHRRSEERPAQDHIGIDIHKRESQICTLAEGGELIEQRIRTEPERFAAVFLATTGAAGARGSARTTRRSTTDRTAGATSSMKGTGETVLMVIPP
jgi:hypothetical protein